MQIVNTKLGYVIDFYINTNILLLNQNKATAMDLQLLIKTTLSINTHPNNTHIPVYDNSVQLLDLIHFPQHITPSYFLSQSRHKNTHLAVYLKDNSIAHDLVLLQKLTDEAITPNHKYYVVIDSGIEVSGRVTFDKTYFIITPDNDAYLPVRIKHKQLKAIFKISRCISEEEALHEYTKFFSIRK